MLNKLKTAVVGSVLAVVPVTATLSMPMATPAAAETINTLDYFVSKHLDKGLSGSHNQNQVVTGNTSYYVKWATNAYEVHTWDDTYIYLAEDHSWKYDQGYAFRPGLWMKRNMQVGESLVQSGNMSYYFSNEECKLTSTTALPYTMTLENHIKAYNVGGDLGKQEVIVLKYDYSAASVNPGNFERFYYSKEWGWVKWELYNGGALIQTSLFNKINGHPDQPDKNISCTRGGATAAGQDPVVYPLPAFKILTGKTVRAFNDSAIYYITQQSQRQYVCDPAVLASYGVAAPDVQVVLPEDLEQYPALSFVRVRDTGGIYKLTGETKNLVTAAAQKKYGIIAPDALPQVDAQDLACYKNGPQL
jgi:hypothetical protein